MQYLEVRQKYSRIIMQVMIPFLRIHLERNEKQLSRRYLQTHINTTWLKEAEGCVLFAFPVAAPEPDKRSLKREGFVLTLSLQVGRAWQWEWLWVWWQGCRATLTLCLQFWTGQCYNPSAFLLTSPASWFGHTAQVYPLSETSLEICPGNAPWRHPEVCLSGDSKI